MNKITGREKVILVRGGIEIWTNETKAERFQRDWEAGLKGAVGFEGRTLNTADIMGVFYPEDIEDMARRKNRQWQCKYGNWHDWGEKCQCLPIEEQEYQKKRKEAIAKCGKCKDGWVQGENGMRVCECIKNIIK